MAQIIIDEGAAPTTPASGKATTYVKTDGLWYSKDDAGNEYILSGAQTTGYPTVPSAATVDIFGAAGVTVGINNSTPVTTTAFTACTTAQVGSKKLVIPAQAWTVTASASLSIDGKTSGNRTFPAESKLIVIALTTSTFAMICQQAYGSFTGQSAGFSGTDPSGTIEYNISGRKCSLRIPAGVYTGTSDSAAFTIATLAAACVPAATVYSSLISVTDNGTITVGYLSISAGSTTINVYTNTATGNFTASGTKAINAATDFEYTL